jgi:hypothetical protein
LTLSALLSIPLPLVGQALIYSDLYGLQSKKMKTEKENVEKALRTVRILISRQIMPEKEPVKGSRLFLLDCDFSF